MRLTGQRRGIRLVRPASANRITAMTTDNALQTVINMIDNPTFSTLALALLLVWIGSKMIGESKLYPWGHRLGVAAALLYTARALLRFRPTTADEFLGIAIRSSLFAFPLSLGLSWVFLASTSWVWSVTIGAALASARQRIAEAHRAAREREEERRQHERLEAERLAAEQAPLQQAPALAGPDALKAAIADIKKEYDLQRELLRSAGLDELELEAALNAARQQYMRRLHQAMTQR